MRNPSTAADGFRKSSTHPTNNKLWTPVMWRASVLTIFPEMFPGPLGLSLAGKALAAGVWGLDTIDIRAQAIDKHRSVDDTPAGGGPGMVMRPDVLGRRLSGGGPERHERAPA